MQPFTFSRVLVLADCILAAVLAVVLLLGSTSLSLSTAIGWVFVVLAVVILVLRRNPVDPLGVGALGAIAGGGSSNLLDRVRFGGVTDFIEIHLWPTNFNLADAAIRIGVVMFILALLLELRRARRPGSI